ncbi:MAG: NAD(P)/FAD-dependent oxidoreductase [Bacteroidota bacterium]
MDKDKVPYEENYDVIVVGAGPAGLGVAIVLQKLGIDYLILEKESIGSTFKKWPEETRFISPSFTGNFFKMPDLNAITPDTSPAFDLLTEHPKGIDYVQYLEGVSKHFGLEIETNIEVRKIEKQENSFQIKTSKNTFRSSYVIWAAGEYQFPSTSSFDGDHYCCHYSEIASFKEIQGPDIIVIGAYESGFDAALNLVNLGKKVTLIDSFQFLEFINSDSSYSLSPFTRDRIDKEALDSIDYYPETRVEKITVLNGTYTISTDAGQVFKTNHQPINCTGFDTGLVHVADHFDFENNYPLLNEYDESRKTNNFFLVGPQVKHGTALFCFIYKYRQRFAIVAEEIARQMKISHSEIHRVINEYKNNNFYLKDLSCCDDECVC